MAEIAYLLGLMDMAQTELFQFRYLFPLWHQVRYLLLKCRAQGKYTLFYMVHRPDD